MIGAEATGHATGRPALGNGFSGREVDHVKGVHVARRVKHGRGKVAGADLGQEFSLDIGIVNG